MGIFDVFDKKPPSSAPLGRASGWTPGAGFDARKLNNDALRSRINPASGSVKMGQNKMDPAKRVEQLKKDKAVGSVFGGHNSARLKDVGRSLIGNDGMKKVFGDARTDKKKEIVANMFGKKEGYVRKEEILKMKQAIMERKVERIKGLSPEMRSRVKNNSEASRAMLGALDQMLKGSKK